MQFSAVNSEIEILDPADFSKEELKEFGYWQTMSTKNKIAHKDKRRYRRITLDQMALDKRKLQIKSYKLAAQTKKVENELLKYK